MRSLAITSLATAVALSALTLAACATSEPEGAASPQDTVLSPESKSDDGGDDAGGSTILPLMDSQPGPVDVGAETLDVVGAPDGLNLDALPETAKEDADAILEQELPESDSADVSDGAPGPEPDPETPCVGQLDGQPCTDEDPCTTDDVCLEEQCIGGLPLECDDLLACNGTETCEDDLGCMPGLPLECDDQDACNGTETCEDDLGCLPGQPLDCDDGVDCTVDSCAEDGACQHAPLPPGASSCETDWATISEELLTKLDLLPSPPMEALPMSWSTHVPQLRHDRLEGGPASQGWAPDTSACDAGLWDPERIATGSAYSLAGQEHCYVTAEPTSFEFRNREGSSYSQPISGEPAWVQARFPVPPGHEIKRLDIHLHYPRLFGSHPEGCHSAEQDEQGSCVLNKDSAWESVPPGFYLLWSQPGAAGHAITGPHLPTVDKLLWWDVVVTPEIPEALLGAQELVVTLLVYRQYPGGCVEQNGQQSCINGKGMKSSLALDAMMLETRATSLSEELPALGHPRVNGDTETWLASQAPFEALPCETLTNAADQVGGLANIKDVWDLRTLGARPCLGEAIPSLIDHPDTGPYVNPPDAEDAEAWAPSTASRERALHAIRRTKACLQGPTPETCHTTDEELAEVIEAYKLYELTHMDSWTWCAGGFCSFGFDLWTAPTVMFWARFVDALWDELNEEEHALILAKTGERIDMYLDLFEDRHWAIFNGNNWTPKLAAGALAWAIAYYYEDPRAPQVAILAMGSMWWHRSFWKADGAYEEGATYGFYSLLPAMQVVHLYDASFGGGVHSIAWEHLAETADWYMDVMSPDGSLLDFGDGHAKYGWDTLTPLYAALAPEWGQQQPTEIDPCLARDYWAFKYWNHGLEDPWFLDPVMARDWKSLIAQCDASPPAQSVRTYHG